jgi:hypothetical protein
MIPFFLIPMFFASIALATQSAFYAVMVAGQVLVYVLAIAGALLRNTKAGYWKPFSVPYYFCFVNAAAFVGLCKLIRGEGTQAWTTRATPHPPAAPSPLPEGRRQPGK